MRANGGRWCGCRARREDGHAGVDRCRLLVEERRERRRCSSETSVGLERKTLRRFPILRRDAILRLEIGEGAWEGFGGVIVGDAL